MDFFKLLYLLIILERTTLRNLLLKMKKKLALIGDIKMIPELQD